jgi:hypothetical protein
LPEPGPVRELNRDEIIDRRKRGVVLRRTYVRFAAVAASLTGVLLAGGAGWSKWLSL